MATDIEAAYTQLYMTSHEKRSQVYQQAIDMLKGLPEWTELDDPFRENLLSPLESRRCDDLKFSAGQVVCGNCGASLPQMESDLAAVGGLRQQALRRIQEFLQPDEKVERVRVADIAAQYQTISSAKEVDELVERLRDHLLKLVESGAKVILE
jgi:hypothetical protein